MNTIIKTVFMLSTISVSLLSSITAASQEELDPEIKSRVDKAILDLAENPKEAGEILKVSPRQYVIPALSLALVELSSLQGKEARREAYHVLHALDAASTRIGFETLIAGLADPPVRSRSIVALLGTSTEYYGELAAALAPMLSEDLLSNERTALLNLLEKIGSSAVPYASQVADIWEDANNDWILRSMAMRVSLTLDGPDFLIESAQSFGTKGQVAVLGALGYVGSKTKGRFNEDPESLARIREFVLERLMSPIEQIRDAAQDDLPMLVLQILFSGEERGRITEEIRKAIERSRDEKMMRIFGEWLVKIDELEQSIP